MPIVFSLQVAGDQTDKGDQTNQGDKTDWDDHGDQTHHSHSIEYEVVRQPSMRNCQYPVSMSESMTIITDHQSLAHLKSLGGVLKLFPAYG